MKTIMNRIPMCLTSMLAVVLLLVVSSARAQEDFKPYVFFGLQGGVQTTFTDYDNWKLITPTTSFSVGVHFTPVLGARIHVNGFWNKGGVSRDGIDARYNYKYATSNMDLMINMVNLFTKRSYSPVNLYLIGGAGINYAWDLENVPVLTPYITASNSRSRQSHNFRVGTMLDVDVADHWSVNLEVAANSLSDRFNAKFSGKDDWQLTAQVGVAYKFGRSHRVKSTPKTNIEVEPATIATAAETEPASTKVETDKPQPKPESKPEPKPEPKIEPKTVATPTPAVKDEDITRNIFFTLRGTEVTAKEQTKLAEVATWLKENPSAKVTITGYADKGTGTAAINARYAKQRAESVRKELTSKYGIKSSRITTDSKGDTVQPFPNDNDLNRVTIIVGK